MTCCGKNRRQRAIILVIALAIIALVFPSSQAVHADPVISPDGWEWQNPLPQGNQLWGIWGSSASDVFAVGNRGTILHYDGKRHYQTP